MNHPIVYIGDRCSLWGGLYFERDGSKVTVEEALKEGFMVTAQDANAVLSLIQNAIRTREECAQ